MSRFEGGPDREQIDIPEGLDPETVNWFMEKFGQMATEIGLDDILSRSGAEASPQEVNDFNRLSKQKPTTDEGKAGALYVLGRVIEYGREAFDKARG